jgi:hypothetical protein
MFSNKSHKLIAALLSKLSGAMSVERKEDQCPGWLWMLRRKRPSPCTLWWACRTFAYKWSRTA